MQQSLPWLRVPSHRHHLRTTRPPPAHPGSSYLTLRSARNFSMMPCPSELSAGCRLPPWQQRARQVPCHPATAYGPRATGAAVPHGQGDTGSARWGSVSFPSCANPRRWHRCFPRWQRWSSKSGSRGRWQPRCGAAWRGGKAGTSLRLPFASPSRGEAKGSAELAASPPPLQPRCSDPASKGRAGQDGGCGVPPPSTEQCAQGGDGAAVRKGAARCRRCRCPAFAVCVPSPCFCPQTLPAPSLLRFRPFPGHIRRATGPPSAPTTAVQHRGWGPRGASTLGDGVWGALCNPAEEGGRLSRGYPALPLGTAL